MKKENNVKKMRWNMKNPDSLKWYFLIGALIGAVLFVLIYGFKCDKRCLAYDGKRSSAALHWLEILPRCSMEFSDWFA